MSKIIIHADKCKGCELCVEACPKKCIEISTDLNKAGYRPASYKSGCTGCGFCYLVCPEVCIEVHKK